MASIYLVLFALMVGTALTRGPVKYPDSEHFFSNSNSDNKDIKGESSESEFQPRAAASEPMVMSERVRRQGEHGGHGVTGPVHTFQKTDKHAHFKWGVRHHVGHEFAGRR